MSLTTLKRTIASMDAVQLRELVTDLYKARPEAKTYLDFFVQPDIDSRLEKARTNIRKELIRQSKGRNRGRITRVRRFIADIASLNPGTEPVLEIMTYAVCTAAEVGRSQWVKEATRRGTARLLAETIRLADSAGLLDDVLPQLRKAIDGLTCDEWHPTVYKVLLEDTLDETLNGLA